MNLKWSPVEAAVSAAPLSGIPLGAGATISIKSSNRAIQPATFGPSHDAAIAERGRESPGPAFPARVGLEALSTDREGIAPQVYDAALAAAHPNDVEAVAAGPAAARSAAIPHLAPSGKPLPRFVPKLPFIPAPDRVEIGLTTAVAALYALWSIPAQLSIVPAAAIVVGLAAAYGVYRAVRWKTGTGTFLLPALALIPLAFVAGDFLGFPIYPRSKHGAEFFLFAWLPAGLLSAAVLAARLDHSARRSSWREVLPLRFRIIDVLKLTFAAALLAGLIRLSLHEVADVSELTAQADKLIEGARREMFGDGPGLKDVGISYRMFIDPMVRAKDAARPLLEAARQMVRDLAMRHGLLAAAWTAFTAWFLLPKAEPRAGTAPAWSLLPWQRRMASFLAARPWLTYALIAANSVVAVLFLTVPDIAPMFIMEWSKLPSDPASALQMLTTAVTYAFGHKDVGHWAFNMLGLWIFGGIIERLAGRRRLLWIFGSGILAGAGAVYFTHKPTLGASAAIFALMGAYVYGYGASLCSRIRARAARTLTLGSAVRAALKTARFVTLTCLAAVPFMILAAPLLNSAPSAAVGAAHIAYESHLWGFGAGFLLARLMGFVLPLHAGKKAEDSPESPLKPARTHSVPWSVRVFLFGTIPSIFFAVCFDYGLRGELFFSQILLAVTAAVSGAFWLTRIHLYQGLSPWSRFLWRSLFHAVQAAMVLSAAGGLVIALASGTMTLYAGFLWTWCVLEIAHHYLFQLPSYGVSDWGKAGPAHRFGGTVGRELRKLRRRG